jgi:hypothetical protein
MIAGRLAAADIRPRVYVRLPSTIFNGFRRLLVLRVRHRSCQSHHGEEPVMPAPLGKPVFERERYPVVL